VNSAPKQMSRLWNGQDVQRQCHAKKEIKMSFLEDVFQTIDEIKQSQEKLKNAVDASSCQAAALIRPYLSEAQNETLSEILEGLVASVAEHSFQIGYSSAMQTFAEAAVALEAGSNVQQ
jgi:DnaJ-domain-containing protein 1